MMKTLFMAAILVVTLVKKQPKEPVFEMNTTSTSVVYKITNPLMSEIDVQVSCGTSFESFHILVPARTSQEFTVTLPDEKFLGACFMDSYKKVTK